MQHLHDACAWQAAVPTPLWATNQLLTCMEMDLEAKFKKLESESYAEIRTMIKEQQAVPSQVFELFLGKIYKRQK